MAKAPHARPTGLDHCYLANQNCKAPSGYGVNGGWASGTVKIRTTCARCGEHVCTDPGCAKLIEGDLVCDACQDMKERHVAKKNPAAKKSTKTHFNDACADETNKMIVELERRSFQLKLSVGQLLEGLRTVIETVQERIDAG